MLRAGDPVDTPLGTVNVRYKPAFESETSLLISRTIKMSQLRDSFEGAGEPFRLAAVAAEFAEILRHSAHVEGADFDLLGEVLGGLDVGGDARPEMRELIELAGALWD